MVMSSRVGARWTRGVRGSTMASGVVRGADARSGTGHGAVQARGETGTR